MIVFLILMVLLGLYMVFEPCTYVDNMGNVWLEYNVVGENRRDMIMIIKKS